jgi:heme/copper-type cytochrome/quinol oxidase subunit 3
MSENTIAPTMPGEFRSGSTATRLRRYTSGAALILFPVLLAVQAWVDPASGGTGDVMTRAAAAHRGALTASALLLLVSGVLMAPAAAAILHQARDRGAALANVGAVLAVLGGFGHAAIAMYYLLSLPLQGGDPEEMVAYIDRLNSTAAIGAVVFPLTLCFALGVVLLVWAAWRAGALPIWAPVAVTVAVLAEELLPTDIVAVETAIIVVMTGVYGFLGLRVLRSTDAAWSGVTPAPARGTVPA